MARTYEYAIKITEELSAGESSAVLEGKYLQKIEPNDDYSKNATAPTMGVPHSYCEFKTVWGKSPTFFEPLTLANHIKILLEENRWETKSVTSFKVIRKEAEMSKENSNEHNDDI